MVEPGGMTQRSDQVASTLKRAVQAVFDRGLNDPRIRGIISVTRVEVARDLRNATVFVSVMPKEHAELTMHGLASAEKHVRSSIAPKLSLRHIPDLHFKFDTGLRREAAVLAAISDAMAELEPDEHDEASTDDHPDHPDHSDHGPADETTHETDSDSEMST